MLKAVLGRNAPSNEDKFSLQKKGCMFYKIVCRISFCIRRENVMDKH